MSGEANNLFHSRVQSSDRPQNLLVHIRINEMRANMEQAIPIEECAKQRLQVLVYAYTLFIKGLMEGRG